MNKIFNRKDQKTFRQHLRNSATPPEKRLWNALKNSQLKGRKFRRQHGVGKYILDFYCPSEKLGIEVDGKDHDTYIGSEFDDIKTKFINEQGIKILRFSNKQIMNNLEGVLLNIKDEFNKTTP